MCAEVHRSSISTHSFSANPYFLGQFNLASALFIVTLVLQDQPQGYILSYFIKTLQCFISFSRILFEFSLKLEYSTMCEKLLKISGVHISRKCIECRHFYSYSSPIKTCPNFLLSHLRQREITHSIRQYFLENLLPLTAERGGRNYDLLYQ